MSALFDICPRNMAALHLPGRTLPGQQLLHRPADAVGLAAGVTLLEFYNTHRQIAPGRIRIALAELVALSSREDRALLSIDPTDRDIAALAFDDKSLLVLKSCDQGQSYDLCPVIYRLCPALLSGLGALLRFEPQGQISRPVFLSEDAETLTYQFWHEIRSWADAFDQMPLIEEPQDDAHSWPPSFPLNLPGQAVQGRFVQDLEDAVCSVLCWAPKLIASARMTALSARPLQGGFEPMSIHVAWQPLAGCEGLFDQKALKRHIETLVFGPKLGWPRNAIQASRITTTLGQLPAGNPRVITEAEVVAPSIAHHRMALMSRFERPPIEDHLLT